MQLSLVAIRGAIRGQVIPVSGSVFSIGRDPQCDLYLPSPIISRKHALLFVRDGKVLLRDLGSRNGTFVNGQLVHQECEIRSDDWLQVGLCEYQVQLSRVNVPADQEQNTDRTAVLFSADAAGLPVVELPARGELSW